MTMTTPTTAYLQTMRNENTWTVRLGIRHSDAWVPFQWEGEDLSVGIHAVGKAALTVSEDESLDKLYMMGTDLDTFVTKCNECFVNWGITVFKTDEYWFALLGYREQYADNEWATACADETIHAAVGQLNPERTCNAVPWRRDMIHRIQPRDANGEFMSRSPKDAAEKRKKQQAANVFIRDNFHRWEGKGRWNELISKANAKRS